MAVRLQEFLDDAAWPALPGGHPAPAAPAWLAALFALKADCLRAEAQEPAEFERALLRAVFVAARVQGDEAAPRALLARLRAAT